jgi:RNA polymerase sigma-70 factor (ECF subfamily)
LDSESENSEGKFVALVNENRLKILKVCHVYAWNPEDRQDLYQEILVQIWRSLPRLRDIMYTNTWLYRVALNTALSFARKHKLEKEKTFNCNQVELDELLKNKAAPDAEINPKLTALYHAISKLDPMEKAIVTLFLEDLSYEQMAEVTGMTGSNVGVTLHRAKKKLATLMEEMRHE